MASIILSIMFLLASLINVLYLLYFTKKEGGDERSLMIMGRLGVNMFSLLMGGVAILFITNNLFGFSFEIFKQALLGLLCIVNVLYVLNLNRLRKQY